MPSSGFPFTIMTKYTSLEYTEIMFSYSDIHPISFPQLRILHGKAGISTSLRSYKMLPYPYSDCIEYKNQGFESQYDCYMKCVEKNYPGSKYGLVDIKEYLGESCYVECSNADCESKYLDVMEVTSVVVESNECTVLNSCAYTFLNYCDDEEYCIYSSIPVFKYKMCHLDDSDCWF